MGTPSIDALTRPVSLPELNEIMTYKSVYALCTVNRIGQVLKATHFCCVLIGGSRPLWGVWLSSGKHLRFASSRLQIAEAYPKLVWRRKMATWTLADMTDKSVESRRHELADRYGHRVPVPE